MQKRNSQILVFILCLILITAGFTRPARAQELLDYGGPTTVFFPCTAMPTWNLTYHFPAGTPIPNIMYSTARLPVDDDDKDHLIPSLDVFGLAAPATTPCLVYAGVTVITIGVGFPSVM